MFSVAFGVTKVFTLCGREINGLIDGIIERDNQWEFLFAWL